MSIQQNEQLVILTYTPTFIKLETGAVIGLTTLLSAFQMSHTTSVVFKKS